MSRESLTNGTEQRVLKLVAQALPRKYKNTIIGPETQLRSQLGVDSLGLLALLFSFEKEFRLDMSKVDLAPFVGRLKTVGDLLTVSQELLEQGRLCGRNE